jgi:hypothetical protein
MRRTSAHELVGARAPIDRGELDVASSGEQQPHHFTDEDRARLGRSAASRRARQGARSLRLGLVDVADVDAHGGRTALAGGDREQVEGGLDSGGDAAEPHGDPALPVEGDADAAAPRRPEVLPTADAHHGQRLRHRPIPSGRACAAD